MWRDKTSGDPVAEGKDQLAGYLERLGLGAGTLMVFDGRSKAKLLPERMSRTEVEIRERKIVIQLSGQ